MKKGSGKDEDEKKAEKVGKEQQAERDAKENDDKDTEDKEKGCETSQIPGKFRMAQLIKRFLTTPTLPDLCPNMAKLACLALVIPVSSVECERAFSYLNSSRLPSRFTTLCFFVSPIVRSSLCSLACVSTCVALQNQNYPAKPSENDLLNWLMTLASHSIDIGKFNMDAAVD